MIDNLKKNTKSIGKTSHVRVELNERFSIAQNNRIQTDTIAIDAELNID